MRMPTDVVLRTATPLDAEVLALQRVAMFREMGSIVPEREADLTAASAAYFRVALGTGEYVGWLATDHASPDIAVGGAGIQLRSMLPRPAPSGDGLLLGLEGLVLNVYVLPAWRRRGIARQLMDRILQWAPTAGVVRCVLHASADGRRLYQTIGFESTNEMRFTGPLAASGPVLGIDPGAGPTGPRGA